MKEAKPTNYRFLNNELRHNFEGVQHGFLQWCPLFNWNQFCVGSVCLVHCPELRNVRFSEAK